MKNLLGICIMVAAIQACQLTPFDEIKPALEANDSIRLMYAPDKRVAVYDIDLSFDNGTFKASGETDQPLAIDALNNAIKELGFEMINQVQILPDSSVGDQLFGVIKNSVANIRSQPKHSGELATQALLGMEVRVLQIKGEWYRIQTPDQYISWVDHGGVQLMTEEEINEWRTGEKIIVTSKFTEVYNTAQKDQVIGDVVLGCKLKLNSIDNEGYQVQYPDGRIGFLPSADASVLTEWQNSIQASGESVEKYALNMIGTPYLWGGTSTKGVDCSGFTKTVYLMNGMTLARDASQQVDGGEHIEPGDNFEKLKKGDLMFFGRAATDSTSRKVTHVAIWLGEGKFIHASQRVRIGSVDPEASEYDEFNKNRFLEARRYLD